MTLQIFFCGDIASVATVNALIPLQSSFAFVELNQDGGVGHVDQDIHEDGEDDEGQDEIYWRGMTKNTLDVTGEPSDYKSETFRQSFCTDTLLVEYDVGYRNACREEPAAEEGNDDPNVGHYRGVLEGGGDVEKPVKGQHPNARDGHPDDPEPDPNLDRDCKR